MHSIRQKMYLRRKLILYAHTIQLYAYAIQNMSSEGAADVRKPVQNQSLLSFMVFKPHRSAAEPGA